MAANRFDQLITEWEARLQRAFLDAIYLIRDQAQIDNIARMLDRGDVDGALRAVGLDPSQFRAFDSAFARAYEAGGVATTTGLPTLRAADGLRVRFQFNIRNPQAENWLTNYSGNLIRNIFDDQKQMIRDVLTRGMRAGINPRSVALDLVGRIGANGQRQGGLIGLTQTQEEWVRNYEAELASTNPVAAMARALRDKRFDRTLVKYADLGQPIPADLRATMVASYRNRALRLRAETIARKEAITALHTAQDEAMRQAVAGGLDSTTVTYVWRTAHDKRVRDTHKTMDGQVRPYGQDFTTGAGVALAYPGDPSGPAAETINCRCFREPKVDFLAGIK